VSDPRSSIENTLNKCAHCYDVGPLEDVGDCFAIDAEMTFVGADPIAGREAVAAEMARRRNVPRYQDGSRPWHVLTTVYTWWMFFIVNADGKSNLTSIGHYDDVFTNDGDTWLIQRRVETLIGRT
jgi:hypothetical protein